MTSSRTSSEGMVRIMGFKACRQHATFNCSVTTVEYHPPVPHNAMAMLGDLGAQYAGRPMVVVLLWNLIFTALMSSVLAGTSRLVDKT
jgi:hypothetical protein